MPRRGTGFESVRAMDLFGYVIFVDCDILVFGISRTAINLCCSRSFCSARRFGGQNFEVLNPSES